MRRDEVIARLKSAEPEIRARGVSALYLYGSHARDDAGASSDIDIFVDVVPGRTLGLSEFMGIHEILTDRLDNAEVDYTTRAGIVEFYRPSIEKEALRVF